MFGWYNVVCLLLLVYSINSQLDEVMIEDSGMVWTAPGQKTCAMLNLNIEPMETLLQECPEYIISSYKQSFESVCHAYPSSLTLSNAPMKLSGHQTFNASIGFKNNFTDVDKAWLTVWLSTNFFLPGMGLGAVIQINKNLNHMDTVKSKVENETKALLSNFDERLKRIQFEQNEISKSLAKDRLCSSLLHNVTIAMDALRSSSLEKHVSNAVLSELIANTLNISSNDALAITAYLDDCTSTTISIFSCTITPTSQLTPMKLYKVLPKAILANSYSFVVRPQLPHVYYAVSITGTWIGVNLKLCKTYNSTAICPLDAVSNDLCNPLTLKLCPHSVHALKSQFVMISPLMNSTREVVTSCPYYSIFENNVETIHNLRHPTVIYLQLNSTQMMRVGTHSIMGQGVNSMKIQPTLKMVNLTFTLSEKDQLYRDLKISSYELKTEDDSLYLLIGIIAGGVGIVVLIIGCICWYCCRNPIIVQVNNDRS